MSRRFRILVVDDEPNIRKILQTSLDKAGMVAVVAESAESALGMLEESSFDCVLTDVTMPGMSGFDLQDLVNARWPQTPLVIMTAYGTIPQAVGAIRKGAFEFVTKPFDLDQIKKIVKAAAESAGQANEKPKNRSKKGPAPGLIAESAAMKEVVETVTQAAASKATVLVTGESGVGKEVVAKLIHELSPRAAAPFVAVSCAALPESLLESELFGHEKGAFTGATSSKPGRFESAHGGTLFLDEIGEVPLSVQVKLLRVLQEREIDRLGSNKPTKVDVRLVTATNRELQTAVDEGVFRLDLMYRLQVVEIRIPPLRERREDILPLFEHFVGASCAENGRKNMAIDSEVAGLLERYSWPGNVRELVNVAERTVVLSGADEPCVMPRHLPPSLRTAA